MNRTFVLLISITTVVLTILLISLAIFRTSSLKDISINRVAAPTDTPINRGSNGGMTQRKITPFPTLPQEKQDAIFTTQKFLPFDSESLALDYSTLTNKVYIEKKNDKADEELQKFLNNHNLQDLYAKHPELFVVLSSNLSKRIHEEDQQIPDLYESTPIDSLTPSPTPNPNDPYSHTLPMMNVFKTLMGLNTFQTTSTTVARVTAIPTQNQNNGTAIPISTTQLVSAPVGSFIMKGLQYDWNAAATSCLGRTEKPGAKAIQRYVNSIWGGGTGFIATCGQFPSGRYSIHTDGRAVDSMFSASSPDGLKKGNQVFGWLLTNAQAIGIQYIKFWRVQWTPNWGITCVTDASDQRTHATHIHYELNWQGANQQTPYFTAGKSKPSIININQDVCPIVK